MAGTPKLKITSSYNEDSKSFTLEVNQLPAQVKDQEPKPLHIPLSMGIIEKDGQEITARTLNITKEKESFTFNNIENPPVPSFLRQFSAPIKLEYDYSDDDLLSLLLNDTDSFSKWEAGQRLFTKYLLNYTEQFSSGETPQYDQRLSEIFTTILQPGFEGDKAFVAQMLTLPSEEYLAEQVEIVDVEAIHNARNFIRRNISENLSDLLIQAYNNFCSDEPYRYDPKLAGARQLKNLCLNLLLASPTNKTETMCLNQFEKADNMTDEISALKTLVHAGAESGKAVIDRFFEKWQNETLVMDKWFAVQATAPLTTTFDRIQELLNHSHFNIKNPNKVRALIGSFAAGNPICFHDKSGQGYKFLTDQILILDPMNPNIASRLTGRLSRWRRYDNNRQALMKEQIERILAQEKISKGVYEIASKSLEN